MLRKSSGARRGMTLVELLVVMIIMVILATVVVAFGPGFQDAQKVGRGADQLQGWLLMARQWAKKDLVPTGLRLSVNSNSLVTDIQYIQQPPIFRVPLKIGGSPPGFRRISTKPSQPTTVQLEPPFTGAALAGTNLPATIGDFTGGYGIQSTSSNWPVQPNDFLVLKGIVYKVTGVASSTTPLTEGDLITLNSSVNPVLADSFGNQVFTSDYYFVRSPRALTGESTLKLPQDIVIDMNSGFSVMSPTNSQYDILFSPSGEVLAPVSSNKVILWVRDSTKQANSTGDDTLIAIDTRTGLIAAQPVNVGGADLYLFTKDGRSSGL